MLFWFPQQHREMPHRTRNPCRRIARDHADVLLPIFRALLLIIEASQVLDCRLALEVKNDA